MRLEQQGTEKQTGLSRFQMWPEKQNTYEGMLKSLGLTPKLKCSKNLRSQSRRARSIFGKLQSLTMCSFCRTNAVAWMPVCLPVPTPLPCSACVVFCNIYVQLYKSLPWSPHKERDFSKLPFQPSVSLGRLEINTVHIWHKTLERTHL